MNPLPWHAEHWLRLQAAPPAPARRATQHALCCCAVRPGLGKRAFAQRFVQRPVVLSGDPEGGDPCGHCRSCLLVEAGTHPGRDLAELPGLRKDGVQRSEIVVEQIRELSARLAMRSQFGGWQVAMIDPADAMNTAAANALLKTLEEPSAQTMLILLGDAPWRLAADHPQPLPANRIPSARCRRRVGMAAGRRRPRCFGCADCGGWQSWPRASLGAGRGIGAPAGSAQGSGRIGRWPWPADRSGQALAGQRADAALVVCRPGCRRRDQGALNRAQRTAGQRDGCRGTRVDRVRLLVNRTREGLRGPLRGDLLLLELLAQWR